MHCWDVPVPSPWAVRHGWNHMRGRQVHVPVLGQVSCRAAEQPCDRPGLPGFTAHSKRLANRGSADCGQNYSVTIIGRGIAS